MLPYVMLNSYFTRIYLFIYLVVFTCFDWVPWRQYSSPRAKYWYSYTRSNVVVIFSTNSFGKRLRLVNSDYAVLYAP